MKKILIFISLILLIGCGQTCPELDGKIIVAEGKTYSIKTAGGKLYYIEEVRIIEPKD